MGIGVQVSLRCLQGKLALASRQNLHTYFESTWMISAKRILRSEDRAQIVSIGVLYQTQRYQDIQHNLQHSQLLNLGMPYAGGN